MGVTCLTAAAAALALAVQDAGPGVFVRGRDQEQARFVPWESEETINVALRRLQRVGGGEVRFAPGTYVIEQAIVLARVSNVRVSGSAAVTLEFAPGPERTPLTLAMFTMDPP